MAIQLLGTAANLVIDERVGQERCLPLVLCPISTTIGRMETIGADLRQMQRIPLAASHVEAMRANGMRTSLQAARLACVKLTLRRRFEPV